MECICGGQSYLCYIFYEIAYYDFIDYILEYTMFPNLKYVIYDLYSKNECPFLNIKATYNL